MSHEIHHVFILQIFFSLNKNLYVSLCDEKQIDVKMKLGLMAQC